MKKWTRTIVDIAIVTGLVLGVAYYLGLLADFPKGKDVYGYLTKIRLINEYFPHINWNPFWDSGTPFSIWSYPHLPMTFTTFVFVRLLGLTAEKALIVVGALAFTLFNLGVYSFVYEVTRKRFAALLSVLLLISSPASWDWWSGGNYLRVFGLPFFSLSLFLAVKYLRELVEAQEKRLTYLLLALVAGLGFSSHLLTGGIIAASIFLIFFFGLKNLGQKIRVTIKVLAPAFLLAAYYYFPLFLTGKPGARFFGINPAYPVYFLNWLFPQEGKESFSLFPSMILLFLPSLFLFFRTRKTDRVTRSVILGFGIFLFLIILYNIVGYLPFYPETWYVVGFPPITAFSLAAHSLAIMTGILLGVSLPEFFKSKKLANGVFVLFLVLNFIFLPTALTYLKKTVVDLSLYGTPESMIQQTIKLTNPKEKNFRFGTDSAYAAGMFNYFYDMPQIRDYFAQGIPYVNWQNWLETAIWAWRGNYPETNFLMDWYAISDFYVGEPHFTVDKFLNQEEYTLVNNENFSQEGFVLYHFGKKNPSRILAATDAPTILVIGAFGEYDVFLRSLAQAGLDSRRIIPLFSQKKVDDFSLDELKSFPAIFLYNYQYRNQKQTFDLLAQYVRGGGNLWIETAKGKELEADNLSEVLPMRKTQSGVILGDWKVSLPLDLRPEAMVEKEIEGKPVIASYELGEGRVIWSGMNYPFYIADKKIKEDVKLLGEIINWLVPVSQQPETQDGEAKFIHPEEREIEIATPRKGVLFKETNFMDWHASANGKKRNIYFAGPGFMYVFLNQAKFPATVIFEYKLSLVEIVGWLTAILTFVGLLLYGVERVVHNESF